MLATHLVVIFNFVPLVGGRVSQNITFFSLYLIFNTERIRYYLVWYQDLPMIKRILSDSISVYFFSKMTHSHDDQNADNVYKL